MKSQLERDYEKASRKPSRKRCNVCGSPEGYSPEGKQVRMIAVGNGEIACNYCNQQTADETVRGVGNRYRGFEVTKRDSDGNASEGFDDTFEREGSLIGTIDTEPEKSVF